MSIEYKFKSADKSTPRAQQIGEALDEISARSEGVVHAADVVEQAKTDERLHGEFEWNDAQAGHHYRLIQARKMIRSIEVVYTEPADSSAPSMITVLPNYVQLRSDVEGYRATVAVLGDTQLRASLLAQADADFQSYRRRYEKLSVLARGFEAMDAALKQAQDANAETSS